MLVFMFTGGESLGSVNCHNRWHGVRRFMIIVLLVVIYIECKRYSVGGQLCYLRQNK